jgi:hypothetical protein
MMPTYSDGVGYNRGTAAMPGRGVNNSALVVVELDFPKIIAERAARGLPALAASDVLEVIPVPPGMVVTNVGMRVVNTAASGTIAIGDGTATAGYLAATAVSSAGYFGGVPVLSSGAFAPTLSGGKLYGAGDTIDALIGSAVPSTAVVRIFARLMDVSVN